MVELKLSKNVIILIDKLGNIYNVLVDRFPVNVASNFLLSTILKIFQLCTVPVKS